MLSLWSDTNSAVRVVRLTETPEVEALVRLFEGIAATEGWEPGGALRSWVDRSIYFALEVNGELIGGLQLVRPDTGGRLPCQSVWPEVPVDPSGHCAHVAILALDQKFRGQPLLFWHLVIEMWRYCVGSNIASFFLEVTPRILPIYQRLGWPLKIEGELREHWGEPCYCCSLGIPEVAASLLHRSENSPYYREIISQAFRVTHERENRRADIVKEEALIYAVC